MKETTEKYLKPLKQIAYVLGIVMIIGGFVYGFTTMGNEFFKLQIETQEKKNIIMTIVSGFILLIEGKLINYRDKDLGKILLLVLPVISFSDIITNTVLYGISQFFSYTGIMNLACDIVNVAILVLISSSILENNKKTKK